jgi:hypothetical protein
MSVGFPVDVSGSSHSFVSDGIGGGEGELVAAVQHDLAGPGAATRVLALAPNAAAGWSRSRVLVLLTSGTDFGVDADSCS